MLVMDGEPRSRRRLHLPGPSGALKSSAISNSVVVGQPARFTPDPDADSVGAGDACSAAVLHGVVRSWPLQQTADLANRLGAFVASRKGATPELPAELLPDAFG